MTGLEPSTGPFGLKGGNTKSNITLQSIHPVWSMVDPFLYSYNPHLFALFLNRFYQVFIFAIKNLTAKRSW